MLTIRRLQVLILQNNGWYILFTNYHCRQLFLKLKVYIMNLEKKLTKSEERNNSFHVLKKVTFYFYF